MSPERRVLLQPAFVLHTRPYRNTSALLEVFSADWGRVALVARGVRGPRSRLRGLLQPFVPLLLSWSGRGDLMTFTGAELQGGATAAMAGSRLMSGLYLNELLLALTQRYDPQPVLFDCYAQSLRALASATDPEPTLRVFERDLLQELGYGLILDQDVESGAAIGAGSLYGYRIERGPSVLAATAPDAIPVHGRTLHALRAGRFADDGQSLAEAKRLMRAALGHYLGGRPLRTRELYGRKVL